VAWGVRALVVLAATVIVASSTAALPGHTYRRVVFIAVNGHGRVTSKPAGLSCPGNCRAFFVKDDHVRLVAHPAPGWKLVKWWGSCKGVHTVCGFDLTDAHDCAAGMCPIGAFGEHVTFARADGSS
jgi:trimeric autotransporter adhesin